MFMIQTSFLYCDKYSKWPLQASKSFRMKSPERKHSPLTPRQSKKLHIRRQVEVVEGSNKHKTVAGDR